MWPGRAAIAGTANGLTINQTSSRGIINWQGFSIGAGNCVQFNNGNGATLKPEEDAAHYGVVDYWTIPKDGYGDCED